MPKAHRPEGAELSTQQRIRQLIEFRSPDADRVPSIPLYMDQVLSYLDTTLRPLEADPKEPCFTKTMINNYVKSGVLQAPTKKKYNRIHLMLMTMLYRFKKTLSLKDIELLSALQDEGAVAKRYAYYQSVEAQVGQALEVLVDSQWSQQPVTEEALMERIVALAVEADAKMRLAEILMDEYSKLAVSKTTPKEA